MLTIVRRPRDHPSTGPSDVEDQSNARHRAAISLSPGKISLRNVTPNFRPLRWRYLLRDGSGELPEPAILLRPLRDFLNSFRLELIDALPPLSSFPDEPRAAENPEVLRDCWTTHPESRRKLVHRGRSSSQTVEYRPSRGVGDREENIEVRSVSGHRKTGNVLVTYFILSLDTHQ